ncbi:MAG TPA: family 16 glycoside hydrolase, partial [Chitinophagaceae bacterium]|nr:family 16 glycoside hydrolase [Chitinophagaceae bacterium]
MKPCFIIGLFIIVLIFSGDKTHAQNGWIKLFNGKNLAGWVIKIKDHPLNDNYGNTFSVENGVMKVSYDKYPAFKEQFGHI